MTLPMITPMLASPSKGVSLTTLMAGGQYVADLKLDGIRCLMYYDTANDRTMLMNRSGVDITHRFPEIRGDFARDIVLDGELVADTGSFQDTAKRDKQNKPTDVAIWVQRLPCTFVAFDVLVYGDQDLRRHPFQARRLLLDEIPMPPGFTLSVCSDDPAFYDTVKASGGEGVIAKRKSSTYTAGRSMSWIKYKAVRSITCVATGYEKGTGARAHFGAMFLHLVDPDGKPVAVGRVGTGFNNSEIAMLKRELDAGHPLLVEIECLNVTRDGSLRFPSFKGVRTDLSVLDARLDQLDAIPRC